MKKLIDEAINVSKNAYVPYSKFNVGAAILLKNGSIITGCNVENASFGLTNCAERTAMFKMVSEGMDKSQVEAIAVVANTKKPVSPCGACRQVMNELLPNDTKVYLANYNHDVKETTINELLPYSFDEVEHE